MSIHVSLATVQFQIPGSQSLKEKRHIVKSLLANLHNKFNVSAAEVDSLDLWQLATVSFVCVGNQHSHVDAVINSAINFTESDPRIIVSSVETETL